MNTDIIYDIIKNHADKDEKMFLLLIRVGLVKILPYCYSITVFVIVF